MPRKTRARKAAEPQQEGESTPRSPNIDSLPNELLLRVFRHLARVGGLDDDEPRWFHRRFPFRKLEWDIEWHRGLRAYPFLAQVCQRWKHILDSPAALGLWDEVTVDFGHEVVTSIHCPLEWSNRRPTEDEFRQSFAVTQLSSEKMIRFVDKRREHIRSLTLLNSEGYWSDEGDFVNLTRKHNFSCAHLGMLVGVLRNHLQELTMCHCNDLIMVGEPHAPLGVLGLLPNLRTLTIDCLRCRLKGEGLSSLSNLRKLENLSISAEKQVGVWAVGLDTLPPSWACLTTIRKLELRSNCMLNEMPAYITNWPHLTALDISLCRSLSLTFLQSLRNLTSLALQGLNIVDTDFPAVPAHYRSMPSLAHFSALEALNLANNRLMEVPQMLAEVKSLTCLDLSGNYLMKIPKSPTALMHLPNLAVVDMRGVHVETDISYWSEAKCTSMRHVVALSKHLRRRPFPTHVLMDCE
mmetsp:Transcript_25479/g.71256  ORF Transcript_25479/g.71256 Transcript_25479/m.71256 type:complete len:465 (+) Transcript_25479:431-1825(+)|eukprot:CAMPEP_0117670900 /NCGR_PEP_ID=MMETSP0804-20121206/13028_1 /TAXON_ID=1074897 /ORGANISM="Tetraselmis astigmatica, Strain CCMP880" /LENGTH=464 /DNA_ID=CAMNT_0005479287 /DNA_START=382 /DNA_END=1776 /DNA_ORIENTATION=+